MKAIEIASARRVPLIDALADFVAGFTPSALPASVLEQTCTVTKNGAACLLAAANPAFSAGRLIAGCVLDRC